MTEDELELLDRELSDASSYLEYGAGESTKLAVAKSGIKHIVCVESDLSFVESRVMVDQAVANAVANGRLEFPNIDIGPTGKWGRPVDRSSMAKWPNYSGAIFATDRAWDLILVDGVFRVACVAAALLQSPKARVLVHDFWRRKRYRPVLDHCDVIETANQLVLLERNPDTTDDALTTLLRKHEEMPTDQNAWQKFAAKLGIKS